MKNYLIIIMLLFVPQYAFSVEVTPTKNPKSGQLTWEFDEPEFSIKLIQLLPDFVSAVFSSRGLPPRVVGTLKDYCVFGTIFRNKTSGTFVYRVSDWRAITPDGKEHKVKTKDEWAKQWADMGYPFHWMFFPAEQNFGVGDWSQGFTTVKLPHGSRFNLKLLWKYQGEIHQQTLENLRCAPAELPVRSNGSQTRN